MIHPRRAGSTVLGYMLAATPGIFWDHEVFGPEYGYWRHQTTPEQFLRRRLGRALFRSYGFECSTAEAPNFGADWPRVLDKLGDLGISRLVRLERRNILRGIVSNTIAHTGGRSKLRARAAPIFQPIHLDPERVWTAEGQNALLPALAKVSAQMTGLAHALENRPHLSLTYEDDVARDPVVGYQRICAFLGVAAADLAPRYRPVNPYPLSRLLTNFEAIAAHLGGTPYAWMLEE
ncbi:MAG: hypothetical protein GY791_00900 [Alphaproteobacteria bacterium]|nr:hypothetical protein [Alphaproteobacteria bacterium]